MQHEVFDFRLLFEISLYLRSALICDNTVLKLFEGLFCTVLVHSEELLLLLIVCTMLCTDWSR